MLAPNFRNKSARRAVGEVLNNLTGPDFASIAIGRHSISSLFFSMFEHKSPKSFVSGSKQKMGNQIFEHDFYCMLIHADAVLH